MTTTFCILGGAGDLAGRLLIPGIALYLEQYERNDVRLLGFGRNGTDYPAFVRESLSGALDDDQLSAATVDTLAKDATFISGDATEAESLQEILDVTEGTELVLYFALAPAVTKQAIDALAQVDLPSDVIVAMEKPFGTDADEADALDAALAKLVPEDRIVRIDHFLHETPVINLSGLIRTTAPVAASWSGEWVESITVAYDESLALEGRADFYDGTGAAVDVIQSHLLQSLARVLSTGSEQSSTEILEAARYVDGSGKRARYTAGEIDGQKIPSYVDEEGVDPELETETLAQFDLTVDTPQWRGTTMRVRTGKAIGQPRQEIVVKYRCLEACPDHVDEGRAALTLPFADRMYLTVAAPDHGRAGATTQVTLRALADESELTPYGRVARGILTHDEDAGVAVGASQAAWNVITPLLNGFTYKTIPLEEYPAGSQGPEDWLD